MQVSDALIDYQKEHLDDIKSGAERLKQLGRVLESYSSSDMHTISNKDLTDALSRWKGATRNRYRAALTHFWKWGRAHGYADLHPTLMPGKEASRDQVLSLAQLRRLFEVSSYLDEWGIYGQLLILTGQRHGDVMRFCPSLLSGKNLYLPTSKNGMPHIVPLSPRSHMIVLMSGLGYRQYKTTAHFKKRWFRKSGVPLSFRLHDIRRSMATHLAEAGEDEADVDRLLNHVASASAKGVARVYNRATRLKQRAEIVQRWEEMLFPDG